ncbi:ompetence-damaged protein [Stutzerimonas decontaminans]|uniref:Ompetence-damaged protein n=1 Tax=Stutzerimonas decontaminans TaxID=3022791 RepID=A0ABX4VVD0_9GAMM|nr:nicotinamide-nucleotide amidohydrolase family protein [Stutzerimonas decontaminans]MCQ4244035.1 nicotinamide-nucleotide amidohydrolase family protein [Stutzerimonas decontaminans]PNF83120.1 ompetence-damaged protein [Stutzerimonas decontaminans]
MQEIEQVVAFLRREGLKLTTAESCTCGLMASLMGDIPGCGKALDSGFVVYSPEAKNRLLSVSFETIEKFGLTSEEVACEMAIGALKSSIASLAVANTGVADDNQEDEGGTQCYAYALIRGGRQVVVSETVQFDGDRVEIRKQAARHGLTQLPERYAQLLKKLEEGGGQ